MIPRALAERELAGLLLNPEQVGVAMGTAGMAVTNRQASMSDNCATMAPQECLVIDGAAEAPVYADSGPDARYATFERPPSRRLTLAARRGDLIKLLDSFPVDEGTHGRMSAERLRSALGLA